MTVFQTIFTLAAFVNPQNLQYTLVKLSEAPLEFQENIFNPGKMFIQLESRPRKKL